MQITLFYTIELSFKSFSERSWQDKAIRDVKLFTKKLQVNYTKPFGHFKGF